MLPTFFKHSIALCIIFLFINVSSFAACPGNNSLGGGQNLTIDENETCSRPTYTINYGLFSGPGTLTVYGDFTVTGNLTIVGTLVIHGSMTVEGNLYMEPGASLEINSGATLHVSGDVDNSGGFFSLFASTSGSVDGTITVGGDFNNNNSGNITVGDGGIIDVAGAYNNNGGSSTSVQDGGTLRANPINDEDQEVDVTGSDDNCTDTCCGDEATCNVLLPVELVSFKASLDAKGLVTLLWETATEINNEGFYIQKSPADTEPEWTDIAFIKGNGNIKHAVSYEYIDQDFTEDSYYRLKQVDFDGQFEIHESIFVSCPYSQEISIYPNPFSTELNIKISDGIYELSVFDLEGHQMHTSTLSASDVRNELRRISGNLEPGTYIISIRSSTASFIERIMKN